MPAAFEHVPEGVDVVAQIGAGVDQRVAHARLRGKMHDMAEAALAEQRCRRGGIGQVDTAKRETREVCERGDARFLQRHVVVRLEIVDADDLGAGVVQRARSMHADEAGRAGHQHAGACERGRHRRPAPAVSERSFAYLRKLANALIAMCAKPAAPSRKPSFST